MKLNVMRALMSALVLSIPPSEAAPGHAGTQLPLLMRSGEEYFIMLNDGDHSRAADHKAPLVTEGLQMELTQRLLGSEVSNVRDTSRLPERERRAEDAPISLDLTFHLLREVLQMARAEQLAQRASHNRKIMEILGK